MRSGLAARMLSWQIVAVAPFRPRPEVVSHVRIARYFERDIRMRRAVSALAIRHYLGSRIEAERLVLRPQLVSRFHGSVGRLRRAPVLMDCARNCAAMLRSHAFAVVLGVAANVEDLRIAPPDLREQMRIGREVFRARLYPEIGRCEFIYVGR